MNTLPPLAAAAVLVACGRTAAPPPPVATARPTALDAPPAGSIRAVDLASGRRLWERPLARSARAYTAARVEGDALVLESSAGVERFAARDGGPSEASAAPRAR